MSNPKSPHFKPVVLAAALATAFVASSPAAGTPAQGAMEKCYGVNAAGKNDCASHGSGMSCSGQAQQAQHPHAFVVVPAGTCNKLHNGSTTPGGATSGQQPAQQPSHNPPQMQHQAPMGNVGNMQNGQKMPQSTQPTQQTQPQSQNPQTTSPSSQSAQPNAGTQSGNTGDTKKKSWFSF